MSPSQDEGEKRVVVDVNALYAQMQAIAEEISRLRALEAQASNALDAVRRAKDSIDAFVRLGGGRILVPLDPHLNAFGFVDVAESDRFIVALGLGYYAELDASKALETLSTKERGLLEQLKSLRDMVRDYTDLYEKYRNTLQAIIAQARQRPSQPGGRGG